ncbi:unnamed protein product [Cuscuta campestris]|uniref:DUF3119 domain-containing protein n=1 Tax=Cuscuta campestris TaxID=132261 RepID=A0A484KD54_9ASTE|nr:unnamed protein product [Cuscuta campestris]
MESALLSASPILPLRLRPKDVLAVSMKCQSSLYCSKGTYNGMIVRKNVSSAGKRSPLAVNSMALPFWQFRRKTKRETIVPDPDYRIPIVLLGTAGVLIYTDNLLAAAPTGLLGLLLLFQTTRVRFVFDDEALEVKVGARLEESGKNVFVSGKNRWKYLTFVNWEMWWPNFPILVYFKETQTKPEGQVHFFPVIFNGKQLYDAMVERCGSSETSSPQ